MKKLLKENKRNFLNHLKKTTHKQMSTVPMMEYSPKKLQMIKDFHQMTEQELEDIG